MSLVLKTSLIHLCIPVLVALFFLISRTNETGASGMIEKFGVIGGNEYNSPFLFGVKGGIRVSELKRDERGKQGNEGIKGSKP